MIRVLIVINLYKNSMTYAKIAKAGFINKDKLYQDMEDMKNGIMSKAWYITNLYCAELYLKEWEENK